MKKPTLVCLILSSLPLEVIDTLASSTVSWSKLFHNFLLSPIHAGFFNFDMWPLVPSAFQSTNSSQRFAIFTPFHSPTHQASLHIVYVSLKQFLKTIFFSRYKRDQHIKGFLKWYALYKSTFTYLQQCAVQLVIWYIFKIYKLKKVKKSLLL